MLHQQRALHFVTRTCRCHLRLSTYQSLRCPSHHHATPITPPNCTSLNYTLLHSNAKQMRPVLLPHVSLPSRPLPQALPRRPTHLNHPAIVVDPAHLSLSLCLSNTIQQLLIQQIHIDIGIRVHLPPTPLPLPIAIWVHRSARKNDAADRAPSVKVMPHHSTVHETLYAEETMSDVTMPAAATVPSPLPSPSSDRSSSGGADDEPGCRFSADIE